MQTVQRVPLKDPRMLPFWRSEGRRSSLRICLLLVLSVSVWSGSDGYAADGRDTSGARAKNNVSTDTGNWLAKIQSAAQKINYSGNFIYQQGAQIQSSRIAHMVDRAGEHEKLEILDGQPREYIRHNDEVKCYLPESRLIITERRTPGDRFPSMLTAPVSDIDTHYKVSSAGAERVAGRLCNVTVLEPRDKLRYGYRLWTDQETGLLLKTQTINERGEVIEQVGFTEVSIGTKISRSHFRPKVPVEGWRIEKLETRVADLTAAGWSVKAPVPGFQKIREVRRVFGDRREVGQIVFSDGLATISVFIETAGAPGASEGDASKGPLNVVSKRYGDHWLTVVGEAPTASIRQVANSIEYDKALRK